MLACDWRTDIYSICMMGYTRRTSGPCLNKEKFSDVINAALEKKYQKTCEGLYFCLRHNQAHYTITCKPTHTRTQYQQPFVWLCQEYGQAFQKPLRTIWQCSRVLLLSTTAVWMNHVVMGEIYLILFNYLSWYTHPSHGEHIHCL